MIASIHQLHHPQDRLLLLTNFASAKGMHLLISRSSSNVPPAHLRRFYQPNPRLAPGLWSDRHPTTWLRRWVHPCHIANASFLRPLRHRWSSFFHGLDESGTPGLQFNIVEVRPTFTIWHYKRVPVKTAPRHLTLWTRRSFSSGACRSESRSDFPIRLCGGQRGGAGSRYGPPTTSQSYSARLTSSLASTPPVLTAPAPGRHRIFRSSRPVTGAVQGA